MRLRLLSVVPVALLAATVGCFRAPPPGEPKLVVVVVFDQMRGDYIERWLPLYGEGGFRRLVTDGVWFRNCHYPYATTTTGPGHASILSGCSADRHGIVSNDWYDRTAGEKVYCAATPRYEFVPSRPPSDDKPGATKRPPQAGNPDRMLSPTVADSLKDATGGTAKIYGLSLKDRSAVLPLGHSRGEAYWFGSGFLTSTYYRDTLPGWVRAYNTSGKADRFAGKEWTRLLSPAVYDEYVGPDEVNGEAPDAEKKVAFPHRIGLTPKADAKYYAALASSPGGNDILLDLAKTCVVAENLGRGTKPDLLVVSFSSNDLVGHQYGPDSHEVLDITLRSDLLMANFLRFLDSRVGVGKYTLILTADHGICPLPEVEAKKGIDARRIPGAPMVAGAEKHLRDVFGGDVDPFTGKSKAQYLEAVAQPSFYLNRRLLASRGISPDAAADELAKWLSTQDGVMRAYTRKQLLGDIPTDDAIGGRVKKSFHADRSGDVVVVLKPYYLLTDEAAKGTSHGTPHAYDTHVPLLVLAPDAVGGRREEPVTPQHAAAIAARYLGVPPPRDCEYVLPATLLKP